MGEAQRGKYTPKISQILILNKGPPESLRLSMDYSECVELCCQFWLIINHFDYRNKRTISQRPDSGKSTRAFCGLRRFIKDLEPERGKPYFP